MSELTRIDAIRIIENITDKDDPAWEWAVEEFYDEESDAMPTIYDVLNVLGVSETEYKEATGAQNTKWPEVELDYAVDKESEIDKLQSQLSQLQAENERLKEDALLYRFIRHQTSPVGVAVFGVDNGYAGQALDEDLKDAAVIWNPDKGLQFFDEALAAEEGEKPCSRCGGRGWIPVYHDDTEPCPKCSAEEGEKDGSNPKR